MLSLPSIGTISEQILHRNPFDTPSIDRYTYDRTEALMSRFDHNDSGHSQMSLQAGGIIGDEGEAT